MLLFFALGLISKPMVVTLPFVLLLLDYWPLNRIASPAPTITKHGGSLQNPFHSLAPASSRKFPCWFSPAQSAW